MVTFVETSTAPAQAIAAIDLREQGPSAIVETEVQRYWRECGGMRNYFFKQTSAVSGIYGILITDICFGYSLNKICKTLKGLESKPLRGECSLGIITTTKHAIFLTDTSLTSPIVFTNTLGITDSQPTVLLGGCSAQFIAVL